MPPCRSGRTDARSTNSRRSGSRFSAISRSTRRRSWPHALDRWRSRGFGSARNAFAFNAPAWRGFVTITGATGNIGSTVGTDRSTYGGARVVAGLDRAGDAFGVGILLGYQSIRATLDREGSKAALHSIVPALFATYASGGWHAQAMFAYSFNDYTTDRRVLIGSALNQTAHGETDGRSPSVSLGGGYDFGGGDLRAGPIARATYTHLSIDSFTETNASAANLTVGDQRAESFRTQLGGHIALTRGGLQTDVALGWQREFASGVAHVTSDFAAGATGAFNTDFASLAGDAVFAGVSLNAVIHGNMAAFGSYQIQAGRLETAHAFVAGLKIRF